MENLIRQFMAVVEIGGKVVAASDAGPLQKANLFIADYVREHREELIRSPYCIYIESFSVSARTLQRVQELSEREKLIKKYLP